MARRAAWRGVAALCVEHYLGSLTFISISRAVKSATTSLMAARTGISSSDTLTSAQRSGVAWRGGSGWTGVRLAGHLQGQRDPIGHNHSHRPAVFISVDD